MSADNFYVVRQDPTDSMWVLTMGFASDETPGCRLPAGVPDRRFGTVDEALTAGSADYSEYGVSQQPWCAGAISCPHEGFEHRPWVFDLGYQRVWAAPFEEHDAARLRLDELLDTDPLPARTLLGDWVVRFTDGTVDAVPPDVFWKLTATAAAPSLDAALCDRLAAVVRREIDDVDDSTADDVVRALWWEGFGVTLQQAQLDDVARTAQQIADRIRAVDVHSTHFHRCWEVHDACAAVFLADRICAAAGLDTSVPSSTRLEGARADLQASVARLAVR